LRFKRVQRNRKKKKRLIYTLFFSFLNKKKQNKNMSNSVTTKTVRLTVIAADGLVKKDLFFKLPDPFGKSRKWSWNEWMNTWMVIC
jgi:hypothetical protein